MTQLFSGITGVTSGAVDTVSPLVHGETAHPPQAQQSTASERLNQDGIINCIGEAGSLAVSGDQPSVNVDGGLSLLYFWRFQHSVGSNNVVTTLQNYGISRSVALVVSARLPKLPKLLLIEGLRNQQQINVFQDVEA
jgi:hypothetical protein